MKRKTKGHYELIFFGFSSDPKGCRDVYVFFVECKILNLVMSKINILYACRELIATEIKNLILTAIKYLNFNGFSRI